MLCSYYISTMLIFIVTVIVFVFFIIGLRWVWKMKFLLPPYLGFEKAEDEDGETPEVRIKIWSPAGVRKPWGKLKIGWNAESNASWIPAGTISNVSLWHVKMLHAFKLFVFCVHYVEIMIIPTMFCSNKYIGIGTITLFSWITLTAKVCKHAVTYFCCCC